MRDRMHILWVVFLMLVSSGWTLSAHAQVTQIIGANLDATGFVPFPAKFGTLCAPGGANCPRTFHPSWTDSTRHWGSTSVNCVTSTDGGTTWGLCTTQPFGGETLQVASSSDGSLVAVATVAGVCTIRRSTNNGTSWNTQFTDANACAPATPSSSHFRCQPPGVLAGRCDYVFIETNVRTRTYLSLDQGVSWVQSNVASAVIISLNGAVFNGSLGAAGGIISAGNRPVLANIGIWGVGGTSWPAPAAGYGASTGAIWSGASRWHAYDTATTSYKQLDETGTVQKTFTPTGAQVVGIPAIDCFQLTGLIDYCAGANTLGQQTFWISLNDLGTSVQLGSNTSASGRATIFFVNNAVYISIAGAAGGSFYRISF